jgi:quercetin dioxygenase-like cupin family protein
MSTTSLTALLDHHLNLARQTSSGRSAFTVYGGHKRTLRQTFIVLIAGHQLDDHENPGEATLQVIRGRVRLVAGETVDEGGPGDLLTIPDSRHRLEALEDTGLLLTVAKLP